MTDLHLRRILKTTDDDTHILVFEDRANGWDVTAYYGKPGDVREIVVSRFDRTRGSGDYLVAKEGYFAMRYRDYGYCVQCKRRREMVRPSCAVTREYLLEIGIPSDITNLAVIPEFLQCEDGVVRKWPRQNIADTQTYKPNILLSDPTLKRFRELTKDLPLLAPETQAERNRK